MQRQMLKSKIHRATITEGSGTVQVNCAAARLVRNGDKVIVVSFGAVDSDPSVLLGEENPDQGALL